MTGVLKVYADGAVRKVGCGTIPGPATALGSPWNVRVGSWETYDGAAYATTSGVSNMADVETSAADGTLTLTKRAGLCGMAVRSTGTQWYMLRDDAAYYWDGSSFTLVQTWGIGDAVADGGTMVAVMSGSHLDFYKNGALRFSGTLLTNNTGATKHGMTANDVALTGDQYESWDFTVGGSSVFFDEFPTTPVPGRLKGYFDGRIWREVCDDDTTSNIMPIIDNATYNSWLSPIVYDGDRLSANWTGMGFGTNYWVIDLGAVTFIDHVNWLLYYADSRTYTNIGLEAAVGFGPWTTIRSPATYQPSLDGSAGLDIPVGGSFRYLRFYSEGNSVNFNNEWVEVEVWAGSERRPIKVYDGTTTRTICMTPT